MSAGTLVYLTYGDVDSPVFKTQVIGFCDFLEQELGIDVHLVSFVPLRFYSKQKKLIKAYGRKCSIFPVVNRLQADETYSRYNAKLVQRIGAESIMTRNPVAAHICHYLQESRGWKFFYDARGCHYKELEEFSSADQEEVEAMKRMESLCFKQADWVYAVSHRLVDHFKDHSRYRNHNHSVVPCCALRANAEKTLRREDFFGPGDYRVFVYAGALSVWNFPQAFADCCRKILEDDNNRLIILSHQLEALEKYRFFQSNRCLKVGVKQEEVHAYLEISDYGILLRKKAVTNEVASPSKFGDYLLAGCKIIISPGIGDLTGYVQNEDCGLVYRDRKDNNKLDQLSPLSSEERLRIKSLGERDFLRTSLVNRLKYRNLEKIHERLTN